MPKPTTTAVRAPRPGRWATPAASFVGGSSQYPADATVDVTAILPAALRAATVSSLSITVGALSAAAAKASAAAAATHDYQIAALSLDVNSPLLAGLLTAIDNLQPLVTTIDTLGLGAVTGLPDLTTLTAAVGTVSVLNGGITADLQTGAVHIDVEKILAASGLTLNDLSANEQILPVITNALTQDLLPALTGTLNTLLAQITTALDGATLLGVPLSALPAFTSAIDAVLAPVNTIVSGLGANHLTPLANGLTSVVSLEGNVQETSAGAFTERALRLTLLPGATPLAL